MKSAASACAALAAALAWVFAMVPAQAARSVAEGLGTVAGAVVDPSGAPIAGAQITFANGELRRSSLSDGRGRFRISQLPAATYVVSARARGFSPIGDRIVAVAANAQTIVRLQMAPAATGNVASLGTVEVNGRGSLSTAAAPTKVLDPQRLAAYGVASVSDDLAQQIALSMTRPAGGAPGLPQTASLRGPDPSETVIDVDGHVMNNANTGDFDLELLDPAMFSSIQVVYGVGPASLAGANTQGGTIDFHTLEPTAQDHGLLRLSAGSFGTSAYTLQATGTASDRLGYALSFHHYYSAGAVDDYLVSFRPDPVSPATATTDLGSAVNATSMLAKLRYAFAQGTGFAEASYLNTVAYRDLTAPLSFPNSPAQFGPGTSFTTFPGASAASISPAWSLDVQLPLGRHDGSAAALASLTARHFSSVADQAAPGIPPGSNPYLLSDRDALEEDGLEYDIAASDTAFSLLADVRTEHLRLPALAPLSTGRTAAAQTQRSYAARYGWDPGTHLHYSAVVYASDYSTFGRSFDPRIGVVWTPNADSALRASFGTAFRSPLLTEVAINPTLTAEHTSSYELGYEHRFGSTGLAPSAQIDAYRTNLRDPIFFVPNPDQSQGQFSFIENLANVVYQGVELHADAPLSRLATVQASYGIDIAYPLNDPSAFDPSAPHVVAGQQFQGIPPHKALVQLDGRTWSAFGYSLSAGYQSSNNELNRPAFWMLSAGVAKTMGNTQIALWARNVTDRFADKFTLMGRGPLYPTPTGPIATNAYSLPGATLTLTVTHRV